MLSKVKIEKDTSKVHDYYIGTSPLVLTSLIPRDNPFFFNLDLGSYLNEKNAIILGVDIYQYTAPLSVPYTDTTKYNGYVLSYCIVVSYQKYLWKNLFLMQIINPLVMDYYSKKKEKAGRGFMLLMATRLGYRFDFSMYKLPCYLIRGRN